ncbi:nuclear transport factor 2 family protein [Mucilaginibacter sp. KACC 22773]|uniref:nuclear transport factor 2 family protein n=1 Tax=Mucilaginibacter sp. KACC 22773 TaxID=3025671 RepID=UPI002366CA4D|nr:nuclear transport factor 2 family protein [Mucilaginibacter sp. KACC 22773]WDF81129.1 nuclear transport factor 2 family protein [Mucilaginibacter sp. KACC 22773]
MKKLLYLTIVLLITFACADALKANAQTITSSTSDNKDRERQKNIEADNILINVFETGDVSKLDAVISPDFYNHTGNQRGIDALKISIGQFHGRMKTVKTELIRQFADDEYVSDWIRYTGSDPVNVIEGMEVTKYLNGKAIEHWFFPYNLKLAN